MLAINCLFRHEPNTQPSTSRQILELALTKGPDLSQISDRSAFANIYMRKLFKDAIWEACQHVASSDWIFSRLIANNYRQSEHRTTAYSQGFLLVNVCSSSVVCVTSQSRSKHSQRLHDAKSCSVNGTAIWWIWKSRSPNLFISKSSGSANRFLHWPVTLYVCQ